MPKPKKAGQSKKPKTAKRAVSAPPENDFQSDLVTPLQRCAVNMQERQATLAEALNRWANVDVVRLERVDVAGRCGWAMWKFIG